MVLSLHYSHFVEPGVVVEVAVAVAVEVAVVVAAAGLAVDGAVQAGFGRVVDAVWTVGNLAGICCLERAGGQGQVWVV